MEATQKNQRVVEVRRRLAHAISWEILINVPDRESANQLLNDLQTEIKRLKKIVGRGKSEVSSE